MDYSVFDSPRLGIALAILVEVVLGILWLSRRERIRRWYLLVGPAIVLLAVLVDWAVETPREKVERVTRQIVQATEDENADLVISLLSDSFEHKTIIKKLTATPVIRGYLSHPLISNNHIDSLEVVSADREGGEVEFAATTTLDPKSPFSAYAPFVKTKWRFDYIRDPDGQFRVRDITMLKFGDGAGWDVFAGLPRGL
jgi:hypothetical protein